MDRALRLVEVEASIVPFDAAMEDAAGFAHESPRTTKLYDRTSDQITLDEVEKIQI